MKRFLTPLWLGVALSLVSCGGSSAPPPVTKEEFVTRYRAAYDAGDLEALRDLVFWEGVPSDLRPIMDQALVAYMDHAQTAEVAWQAWVEDPNVRMVKDGRTMGYVLKPEHWLVVELRGRPDSLFQSGTLRVPVARDDDGQYWIPGPRWRD